MASGKIDAIDRRILAELQADGRMTNVELSKRLGISAPPCLRRVRALEEAGLLVGEAVHSRGGRSLAAGLGQDHGVGPGP